MSFDHAAAITVEGLSKRYRLGAAPAAGRLTEAVSSRLRRLGRRPPTAGDLWALRDVHLTVRAGEAVGLIGHNGAGKSTLLKVLTGITEPTSGRALLRGRVASLLEVGTGFHPELTGRENIFLYGAILGMGRRETQRKFDEIVAFADVERFLDTPVKRYSSGMYVRLAFAVAAHLEPDILFVDEVLAVGDAAFQTRSLGKMGDVAQSGRTVVLVSHNLSAISRLCRRAVWLDEGEVKMSGSTEQVVPAYLSSIHEIGGSVSFPSEEDRDTQITSISILNGNGEHVTTLPLGSDPTVEVAFVIRQALAGIHLVCIVTNQEGLRLLSTADTDLAPDRLGLRQPGQYLARTPLPLSMCGPGTYKLTVAIARPGVEFLDRRDAMTFSLHDTSDSTSALTGPQRPDILRVATEWEYTAI